MSLTTEIKLNKELRELIKNSLNINNKKILERKSIKYELIGDFKEAAIVGTAYDYLLRLKLLKGNDFKEVFYSLLGIKVYFNLNPLFKTHLTNLYNNSHYIIKQFLNDKPFNKNDLICSAIFLSFLDEVFRRENFDNIMNITSFEDIKNKYNNVYEDLINLNYTLKNIDKFKHSYLNTNPAFSNSDNIGGADADLIIDKTLIDIKTITTAELTLDILGQVLIYSIMANYDGIKIKNVGIYFSRYDYLEVIKIKELINKKDLNSLKKYLENKYNFKKLIKE